MMVASSARLFSGVLVTTALLAAELMIHFSSNRIFQVKIPKPAAKNQTMVQLERIARINETCHRHGLTGKGVFSGSGWGLHVVKSRGVAYCENPKTGCSSWKQILLWLKGGVGKSNSSSNNSSSNNSSSSSSNSSSLPTLSPVLRLHLRANSVLHVSKNGLEAKDLARFPRFVREQGLMLFTTVRHPFDRLVSAFENKILYRKDPGFRRLSDSLGRNFSRFADLVLKGSSKPECDPGIRCWSLNGHWRPYAATCHYCALLPGKFE